MVKGTLCYYIASGPHTLLSFSWLLFAVLDVLFCSLIEFCSLSHVPMGSESCVLLVGVQF